MTTTAVRERMLELRHALLDLERRLHLGRATVARNLAEQRARVLAAARQGRVVPPRYRYADLPTIPTERVADLRRRARRGGTPLHGLVPGLLEERLAYRDAMATHRGDAVTSRTATMYGRPSSALVDQAERRVARRGHVPPPAGDFTGADLATAIERTLQGLGVADRWWVTTADGMPARFGIRQRDGRVRLRPDVPWTRATATRLLVHEIGVHVARTENGLAQPWPLLAVPLRHHMMTEEGLAVATERRLGLQTPADDHRYDLRYLAASWAVDHGFTEVLERLLDHTTPEEAVDIAVRAKRAIEDVEAPGCHLKDTTYLGGAEQVAALDETDRDLLHACKQPVELLPLLRGLERDGMVTRPRLTPEAVLREGGLHVDRR